MSGHTPVNGKERKMKTPKVHFIPELLPNKNLGTVRWGIVIMSCCSSIQHPKVNLKPEGHYVYFFFFFLVVPAHTRTNQKETHNEPAGILAGPSSSFSVWSGTWWRRLPKEPTGSSRVYCVCPGQKNRKFRTCLLLALEVFSCDYCTCTSSR